MSRLFLILELNSGTREAIVLFVSLSFLSAKFFRRTSSSTLLGPTTLSIKSTVIIPPSFVDPIMPRRREHPSVASLLFLSPHTSHFLFVTMNYCCVHNTCVARIGLNGKAMRMDEQTVENTSIRVGNWISHWNSQRAFKHSIWLSSSQWRRFREDSVIFVGF